MIFKLYRCLKPESSHFYEIGQLVDMESGEYHDLKFINGDEETLQRVEVEAINCIDTNTKQSWEEVTKEQYEFLELFKGD